MTLSRRLYVKFYSQIKVAEVVSMCLWDEFVHCELYITPTPRLAWLYLLCGLRWHQGMGNFTAALKMHHKTLLKIQVEVSKTYLHCRITHLIKYLILKPCKNVSCSMYLLTYGQLWLTLSNMPAVFKKQKYFVFRQHDKSPEVYEKADIF